MGDKQADGCNLDTVESCLTWLAKIVDGLADKSIGAKEADSMLVAVRIAIDVHRDQDFAKLRVLVRALERGRVELVMRELANEPVNRRLVGPGPAPAAPATHEEVTSKAALGPFANAGMKG